MVTRGGVVRKKTQIIFIVLVVKDRDNRMEDKETRKDMQDTLDNDLTKTELKGEDHLPPSPLEEEQIPGDNVQLGDPDDKEEESPSENVELQTANKEHYPIQDAELRMEGPDDNERENPGIKMELQKEDPNVDKEENCSEDEGLQSEDPDVAKEQNPSENVELPLEGPDDKGSLSPDEKEQNPSETVKLPIDGHGLVETAVSETAPPLFLIRHRQQQVVLKEMTGSGSLY